MGLEGQAYLRENTGKKDNEQAARQESVWHIRRPKYLFYDCLITDIKYHLILDIIQAFGEYIFNVDI